MQRLSIDDIDRRMQTHGFAEMRWLWERFKSRHTLDDLDPDQIDTLYRRHTRIPGALLFLALGSGLTFQNLNSIAEVSSSVPLVLLLSALGGYLALFLVTLVYRVAVVDWKEVASLQLAFMVSRPDYRQWLAERHPIPGLEGWDDSQYVRCYDRDLKSVESSTPKQQIQQALRAVLGHKEDNVYQPGRYTSNLKSRKKSVTGFVKENLKALELSKAGVLEVEEGRSLLKALSNELVKGSAGRRFLADVIGALGNPDFLPPDLTEVRIWKRDPWCDLTRAEDFYSSASLRGDSWRESIERRTKGMLGPFGYLRNPSISALDFRTSEGRCLRARMAAAHQGARRILFVDGVEGRYQIKPSLIRRAIEDYAREAGFDQVFYHAFPLNKVPLRFVNSLKNEARLERLDLSLADASQKQYLDAFGLPLEPFEYAPPRGKVVGYSVDTGGGLVKEPDVPGALGLWWARMQRKALLWVLLLSTFVALAWMLYLIAPMAVIPTSLLMALSVLWERRPRGTESRHPVEELVEQIKEHPLSVKMSYEERLREKGELLRGYFPKSAPTALLEEILSNPSIKATHLENYFRFLKKVDRKKAIELLTFLWPSRNEVVLAVALSEQKKARTQLAKKVGARLDLARRVLKSGAELDLRQLRRVATVTGLGPEQTLRLVAERPRIVRGLWKSPRPIYVWPVPLALACLLLWLLPVRSAVLAYLILVGVVAAGSWALSTRTSLAPGILTYEKTGRRLREVFEGGWKASGVVGQMNELGIDTEAYLGAKTHENPELKTRIEIRDRRTVRGAAEFLTSSEEIGNCIALRNFVSWCLPSLLDDESIMLADVTCKGGGRLWQQRAQLWMVAAECEGRPVLTVNSLEFNNEGVKHLDVLMPEIIEVLRDVARRCRFTEIYVGISDYGREWLDTHFEQGTETASLFKVHARELGNRYYFDSFTRGRGGWRFMRQRTVGARLYALSFGALEWLQGNRAKAKAFFDSARNVHNFWKIPVD